MDAGLTKGGSVYGEAPLYEFPFLINAIILLNRKIQYLSERESSQYIIPGKGGM